jgi:hypothetical protein
VYLFLSTATQPEDRHPMTTSLQAVGLNWQGVPVHPVKRASSILGASDSQTYALLNAGELTAVTLGGKTLVTTASLVEYLAKAQPWRPDRDRVAKAVAARPDVARKAAKKVTSRSTEPPAPLKSSAA